MSSLNKVILIGFLGADPEVRYTANGDAVASVRLATTENWRDKSSGDRKEQTEWHRIVFYGRLAEIVGEYMKKGRLMFVEGRLQTRKWQDQAGNDRYTTEIVGNEMKMLGGKNDNDSTQQRNVHQESEAIAISNDDFDSDIPF